MSLTLESYNTFFDYTELNHDIPYDTIVEVQKQFDRVIEFSQKIFPVNSDRTLLTWAGAKSYYYKVFGNKLIYEYGKVDIKLSAKAKKKEKSRFVYYCQEQNELSNCIPNSFFSFLQDLSPEEFFNNSLSVFHHITTYDDENKTLGIGNKVIKAFKYFISNQIVLRKLQDKASEIIQQNNVSGILCLSIHPLDFLSSSENASNWRSCHALDGEYRAGNLSYLMDESTIMAYVKSPQDKSITRFPFAWNDKKWRMLLHFDVNLNFIFAGRPYPYAAEGLLHETRNALASLPEFCNIDKSWSSNRVSNISYECYNSETEIAKTITLEGEEQKRTFNLRSADNRLLYDSVTARLYSLSELLWKQVDNFCHYNDLVYSSCYFPFHISLNGQSNSRFCFYPCLEPHSFHVGHEAYCLYDGIQTINAERGDLMCCDSCVESLEDTDYQYCYCCDSRTECYEMVDGHALCSYCYEHNTAPCPTCGQKHLMSKFKFSKSEKALCIECFNKLSEGEKEQWLAT